MNLIELVVFAVEAAPWLDLLFFTVTSNKNDRPQPELIRRGETRPMAKDGRNLFRLFSLFIAGYQARLPLRSN